jgi:hypothetical protein
MIALITDYATADKIMDYLNLTVAVKNPSLLPKSLIGSHSWPSRVMRDRPAYHIIFPENRVAAFLFFLPPYILLLELFFWGVF